MREEHEFTENEINIIKHNMKISRIMLDNYDPEVSNIIPLLVGSFVFAKDKEVGAASRSDCLGVTFLNPQPDWQLQDYAECILHESIHQSIFLDDMINAIYLCPPLEMAREDALITSAIRKTKRPYDLSFHSACVSATIIDFNTKLGMSKNVPIQRHSLLITLNELRLKEKYLTERGKKILSELEELFIDNS